ncbi:MAG: VRR-NUC domain-containing protein [Alphaproteobacteria bacterium]|nr:VRR-NUC domain-containing protein [Alphaproteobacteria bacterium]
MVVSPPPSPATDLRWVLARALERGRHLLTPDELEVVLTLQALDDPALSVWARIARRTHAVQRYEHLGEHAALMLEAGLVVEDVPWADRAARCTVPELQEGLRAVGRSTRGRRDTLVERLAPHAGWSFQRWVRVEHRELLRRCDRLAFLERHPDPARPVIERLGHVRWVAYPTEPAPPLFADREALLRWEAVLDALVAVESGEEVDLQGLLQALREGHARAPGRLDAHRRLGRTLLEVARDLERAGEPEQARAVYREVAVCCPERRVAAGIREARTLEASGAALDALGVLSGLRDARGPEALAVHRAGRRTARACRRSWAPPAPHPPLRERNVRLPRAGHRAGRPVFGDDEHTVELAVIELLTGLGRTALHAEGGLWRHLYGLLLGDALFAPVGQLPAPFLAGPLDLGTSGFAERRPVEVERALRAVAEGRAPDLVRRTWEAWEGCQIAGVRWESVDRDVAIVEGLGPGLLNAVLSVLLERGWKAARGLPDLAVLPGPSTRIPGALPSRLTPDVLLVEVKTPNDTLSDAQRWWLARLEPFVTAEVWRVTADP